VTLGIPAVIACNKREAFVQGSNATKQSMPQQAERWIACAPGEAGVILPVKVRSG